jgi:hypothetical protein
MRFMQSLLISGSCGGWQTEDHSGGALAQVQAQSERKDICSLVRKGAQDLVCHRESSVQAEGGRGHRADRNSAGDRSGEGHSGLHAVQALDERCEGHGQAMLHVVTWRESVSTTDHGA